LGLVKRIGDEYGSGSTGRVAGEPKARHSHLKPGATFAVPLNVYEG